jgi:hypothetical protein
MVIPNSEFEPGVGTKKGPGRTRVLVDVERTG